MTCAVIGGLSTVLRNGDGGQVGVVILNENSSLEFAPIAPNAPDITCPFDASVIDVRGDGSSAMVPNIAVIVKKVGRQRCWLPKSRQTLVDASIVQQGGKTVLTFTKPRFEEVGVSPGSTQVLRALGKDNRLAVHAARGSASLAFTSCTGEDKNNNTAIVKPFIFAPDAPDNDCPFHDTITDIRNDKSIMMRHVINENDATVTI